MLVWDKIIIYENLDSPNYGKVKPLTFFFGVLKAIASFHFLCYIVYSQN